MEIIKVNNKLKKDAEAKAAKEDAQAQQAAKKECQQGGFAPGTEQFLREINLGHFSDSLAKFGVATLKDLADPDIVSDEALLSPDIGMRQGHVNKLRKSLAKREDIGPLDESLTPHPPSSPGAGGNPSPRRRPDDPHAGTLARFRDQEQAARDSCDYQTADDLKLLIAKLEILKKYEKEAREAKNDKEAQMFQASFEAWTIFGPDGERNARLSNENMRRKNRQERREAAGRGTSTGIVHVRGATGHFGKMANGVYDLWEADGRDRKGKQEPAYLNRANESVWLFLAANKQWFIHSDVAAKDARQNTGFACYPAKAAPGTKGAPPRPEQADKHDWQVIELKDNQQAWGKQKSMAVEAIDEAAADRLEASAGAMWDAKVIHGLATVDVSGATGQYAKYVNGTFEHQRENAPDWAPGEAPVYTNTDRKGDAWLFLASNDMWYVCANAETKNARKPGGLAYISIKAGGLLPHEIARGNWLVYDDTSKNHVAQAAIGVCGLTIEDADNRKTILAADTAKAWETSANKVEKIIIASASGSNAGLINGTFSRMDGERCAGTAPVYKATLDGHDMWLFFATDRRWYVCANDVTKDARKPAGFARTVSEVKEGTLPHEAAGGWEVYDGKDYVKQDNVKVTGV